MFSKKATKIEEIFTADLTLCSKCQIDGEDFVNFCGLLRKHELYTAIDCRGQKGPFNYFQLCFFTSQSKLFEYYKIPEKQ